MNKEIIKLMSKYFQFDKFKKGKAKDFKCCLEKKCGVKKEKEPIWSAALGDKDSKVMIVAEAPSAKGGLGPHIGGKFKEWKGEAAIEALKRFTKKYFDTVPYFTDVIKCGVSRQTKDKKKALYKRKDNCIKEILLKEIKIISPEIILCVGRVSYDALRDIQEKNLIDNSIKLIHLIHYGNNASLQLTIKDKESLIWPFQAGKVSKDKMVDLSYFS